MQQVYYLFVYGSLRSGFKSPAYDYISKYFSFVAEGKAKGLLYDMGKYPVAKSCVSNHFIKGELYQIKNIDEYPYFSTIECGRKNTCKICSGKLSKLRNKLRSENPPPISGFCPICNVYTEKWILDHCHYSHNFRGYICNNCNLGIGRFNDDISILYNAIEYLNTQNNIQYHI